MSFPTTSGIHFFRSVISNPNASGIEDKTRLVQEDFRQAIRRDNGASKNVSLIDKSNIHNNRLQVINQYENTDGKRDCRYDATILVNGLPLVHVELKRKGMVIRVAPIQIGIPPFCRSSLRIRIARS